LPSVGAQFIEPVLAELSLCSYKLLFGNPATSILIRARGFASHPFGVVCLYRSNYSIFKDYLKMFPNALFMFYLALIIYNKKEAELSNFRTPPSAFHRKCGLIIRLDSSVTRLPQSYGARGFASHPFGMVCHCRSSYSIFVIMLSQLFLIVKLKIVNFPSPEIHYFLTNTLIDLL